MKDKAISLDLLAQCRCRQKRGRHESKEDYASRLTHIGLSKRAITEMVRPSHSATLHMPANIICPFPPRIGVIVVCSKPSFRTCTRTPACNVYLHMYTYA